MRKIPFLLLVCWALPTHAVTLEQIVSREHPDYNNAAAIMTVGQDGNVYLSNKSQTGRAYNGFVLRVTPDGKQKASTDSGPAGWQNATANAQGIVASTHTHFTHQVRLHDRELKYFTNVNDFTNNNKVHFDSPARVEATPSGDFYALAQNDGRILRISPQGKVLRAHSYPEEYGPLKNQIGDFRLHEPSELFFLAPRGKPLTVVGFDGKQKQQFRADTSGGWDVDEKGVLHAIGARSDTVKKYSADGKPAGEVKFGGLADALAQYPITALQVHGDEFFVKRNHPTEMFRRYKVSGGAPVAVVPTQHERLAVEFPALVWTAGESTPFTINFTASQGTVAKPQWRVWARPFSAPLYRELTLENGRLQVPKDWGGLYVLKVSPESRGLQTGDAPEYLVREAIEVRRRDSRGTINLLTPLNRAFYGRGEAVTVHLLVRAAPADMPQSVTVKLVQSLGGVPSRDLATEKVDIQNGKGAFTIPASLTAALRPGEYSLEVEAVNNLTPVAQPLIIGPGVPESEPYLRLLHGDYSALYPDGNIWDAADQSLAHAQRYAKIGVNMFVDGIGKHTQIRHLNWGNSADAARGLDSLQKRLASDPLGVAPEIAQLETPLLQTQAAYSALGMRQMAFLMYMDAGLPLGTGHDKRTPEQLQEAIRTVTQAMLPYASFRGWSWTANWWLTRGQEFKTPQEKQQHEVALKTAQETGEWSPILETIAQRRYDLAIEAQELFNRTLHELAPDARVKTATSGPYRRPEAHPPAVFSNVDEVDLHYQAEQIAPPQWTPHAVDYMKRPGKAAWGHPEIRNDSGTGGMILPHLLQMVMRGVDGIGQSGKLPNNDSTTADSRSASAGLVSNHRAIYHLMKRYGRWVTDLQPQDPVAIVVSSRQAALHNWAGVGSLYFSRQFEAYQSCLYMHRPATFVFSEDLDKTPLTNSKVLLVVGQTVQMEPKLKTALAAAKAKGSRIFYDGTCRKELVSEYSPLGVSFDHIENDPHVWQDDSVRWRFLKYFLDNTKAMQLTLGQTTAPIAQVDNPQVLISQRDSGGARYYFAVNNTLPTELSPGQLWRVTMALTTRVPLQTEIRLPNTGGQAVYDVFAMKRVASQNGAVTADLRDLPMRAFAVLPRPIGGVALRGLGSVQSGQRFAWWAQVRDEADAALDAAVPLRVRLLDEQGSILEERFLSSGKEGTRGEMTLPLNIGSNAVLEATELISGKSSLIEVNVAPASAAPLPTLGKDWQGQQSAMNPADTSGTSGSTPIEPAESKFGPHLRDVALLDDGQTAVFNSFEWNHNLYALDTTTGKVLWRQKVGDYFAFAPEATTSGVAVQGFDFNSAEGYHLHLLNGQGAPGHRFALPGLPQRATFWFLASMLRDRINNFTTAPDGSWVAGSGNLGVAVWDRDGKELWQKRWSANDVQAATLLALDKGTLLTARGAVATAYDARSGQQKWQQPLADGELLEAVQSADGSTLALRSTAENGTVFILRGAKVVRRIPTPIERLALSSNGDLLAVTSGKQLRFYSLQNGLQWIFAGDDRLHFPRFATDGRLAASSDLGTVYVLDTAGKVLLEKDMEAMTVPAWLPGGDLLLGTWMGSVVRLDRQYVEQWRAHLRPATEDMQGKLLAQSPLPTARMTDWSNAAEKAAPLAPNLLAQNPFVFQIFLGDVAVRDLGNDPKLLADGSPDAPPEPWLKWSDVQMIESGWRGEASASFDFFNKQVRLKGITFVEDPRHPESWMRQAKLQYWDATQEQWKDSQPLLSDTATHTHWLKEPIEAAKFRLVKVDGYAWPVGSIRWGEIVLHGDVLGASHPDVVAKKPVATLLDEQEADLTAALEARQFGNRWQAGDAFSGGHFFLVTPPRQAAPGFTPPFGHMVPNWQFEIVENPQPGQYRYLQFAWKALAEKTTGMALQIAPHHATGVAIVAGAASGSRPIATVEAAPQPPREWTTVRVDLWQQHNKQPFTIGGIRLVAEGGPAAFDNVLLARTEADLPTMKPAP